jgi:hypothetical protein
MDVIKMKSNIIEIKLKRTFFRKKYLLVKKYGKNYKIKNEDDFKKLLSKTFGVNFSFKDFDLNKFPSDFYYFIKRIRIGGELLFEIKDSLDRLFLCEYGRKKSICKAFSYLDSICGLVVKDESENN